MARLHGYVDPGVRCCRDDWSWYCRVLTVMGFLYNQETLISKVQKAMLCIDHR